jgi:predicted site-specific integrase-resolvase
MNGHGEKLSRRMEAAVAALLVAPTLEAAAQQSGVSVTTLRRWLRDPEFQRQFRAARRQVVEQATTQLQQSSGRAVHTLYELLSSDHPGTRCKAAVNILQLSIKSIELDDVLTRLADIEAALEKKEPNERQRTPGAR